ncbi:MAG: carboxylating nicotinate-nucleotide diphosphorylase [Gemmatimonadota bacterium]
MKLGELVRAAIEEDVGTGDRTTLWTVPPGERARARVLAREDLVVAGTSAFAEVFRQVAPSVEFHALLNEGAEAGEGDVVAALEGPARGILTAERTALNFLGRLSGIATLTREFVRAVEGTGARVLDTRKTTPGWRELEKAAVASGGGENHRFGLYDMVLVKENHIAIAGGIPEALTRVREENVEGLHVEVEVASLADLELVRGCGVDRVLLDNMTTEEMSAAVETVRRWPPPRPLLEASGNMSLLRVAEVARVGVDCISVGALTHSAPVADLSLLMEEVDHRGTVR